MTRFRALSYLPLNRSGLVFLVVLPTLVGFDWGTKELARGLPLGAEVPVIPGWLSFVHAENPNAAFSMPVPLPMIVAFGVVALIALGIAVWRLPADARLRAAALGAIGAGALGNLVDRLGDGTVTDMVRMYTESPSLAPWLIAQFGTATWPIWNVADAALLSGVALWILRDATEPEGEPAEA
ncbi:MAG: signal peptidase II [Myxococcota bacterium]